MKLGTVQEQQAAIQKAHQDSLKVYKTKFESNYLLNFFDLWEYVERKLQTQDGSVCIAHPVGNVQHPSASDKDP